MSAFRVSSSVIMEVGDRAIEVTSGFVFRQTRTILLSDVVSATVSGNSHRSLELHLADGSSTRYRFGSPREAERAHAAIAQALQG